MHHSRPDYNRITDPALSDPSLLAPGCSPIGENEPVFLLRAQDKLFIPTLRAYAELLHGRLEMVERAKMASDIYDHIERAESWQKTHQTKVPDLPK